MKIGEALSKIRFDKKMAQKDVAKKVKVTATYLSQVENGIKTNPSKQFLERLCKVYDIPYPILIWMAMDEKDVQPKKKKAFQSLKPAVDNLISEFFK